MSDEEMELTESERQRKQLQLVGYGIVFAGLLTFLVAYVSTRPYGILVVGLTALAISMLVFEKLQGGAVGVSLGLLTGSFGVWLWPHLDGGSYFALGGMLVLVGVINAMLAPEFRDIGERLANR